MNKHQKAFLKTLLKSIDQAHATQESIFNAIELGLSNAHKRDCVSYARSLQKYIDDANRMVMDCTMAYGKPQNIIAAEAFANQVSEN